MGVIDLCNISSSSCIFKSSICKPSCGFEVNQRRVFAMASTLPVKQVTVETQQKVSGDSFIRPHLRKLSPYQPILPFEVLSTRLGRKPEDIIKLDANENPYGPPPEVFEALGNMKFPYIYPDPESRRLRAALAEDSGLEAEYILAGCGADELIDLIMRCVLEPGEKIVDCPPTFTMYEFDANVNGAGVIKVPRNADFSLDVEKITETVELEKPKCIFLTSPNNPDGSIINDGDLLKILNLPVLVILDEAYVEFSGLESRMKWVKQHENLIVLRTFSKRAGLAGLRVGYGAFPASIIEYIWRAKQPYNVSVAAEVAACAALQNPTYLENVKDALVKERERLFKLLEEVPFLTPYPSYSNFILCKVTSGLDAKKLKEDLAKMGVMIRHYNNKELGSYVRVSVGLDRRRMMVDFMVKTVKDASFMTTMTSKIELEKKETEKSNNLFKFRKWREMYLNKGTVSKVKMKSRTKVHILQPISSTMSIISLFVFYSVLHPFPIKIHEKFYSIFQNKNSVSFSVRKPGITFSTGRLVLHEKEMIEDALAAFTAELKAVKAGEDEGKLTDRLDELKNRSADLKQGIDLLESVLNELFEDVIKGRKKVMELITTNKSQLI